MYFSGRQVHSIIGNKTNLKGGQSPTIFFTFFLPTNVGLLLLFTLFLACLTDKTIKLWKISERDKRPEGYNLKEEDGRYKHPNNITSLRVSLLCQPSFDTLIGVSSYCHFEIFLLLFFFFSSQPPIRVFGFTILLMRSSALRWDWTVTNKNLTRGDVSFSGLGPAKQDKDPIVFFFILVRVCIQDWTLVKDCSGTERLEIS